MTILARRYKAMGLSMQDVLFLGNDVVEYLDAVIRKGAEVKLAANWIMTDRLAAIKEGTISGKIGKQITDPVEMEKMVMKVFSKSPKQLEQYRSGRTKLQGFFCWPGKANPALLNKILLEKLNAKE
ncbi:hypothetical protein DY000_02022650 [Brassica cretica]|uniref:Asn/Gln amidotransferase domain-containing protein n=1 Tax=Brassica cretica TaxID=69181 RepID=A0ABQ7EJL4_BRACR|nr:hypothetical protein DY000_02022650 [Brassica cretica]